MSVYWVPQEFRRAYTWGHPCEGRPLLSPSHNGREFETV